MLGQRCHRLLVAGLLAFILTVWWLPTESIWAKTAVGAAASIIVLVIIYLVAYFRYKPEPVMVSLSPLYTDAGYNQFRAAQRAEFDETARLTAERERLLAAMLKLDVTTQEGQRALKELARQKKPVDARLAVLKKQQRRIGFRRW